VAGTKKQKMSMSKAIVEAIYSMDPTGRFLKQCPESCQWNELSKRDAADRVAQAMSYAVRGKDTTKRRKEERRRSRRISRQESKNNDVAVHLHSSNNQLEDNASSSLANHKLSARGSIEGDSNNTGAAESTAMDINCTDSSADKMPLVPGNSNLHQQQLQSPPQLNQSSAASTVPTSSIDQNVSQNGLVQVLAQAVQQQGLHHDHHQQQQQLLQSILGQNLLGQLLYTQTAQPASFRGLTHQQLLAQNQQQLIQQQQQQQQQQQLVLLQHLLNAQIVLPPESLLATLSPSATSSASQGVLPTNNDMIPNGASSSNYSLTPQPETPANMNISQPLQQQSIPSSNGLLLSNILSNLHRQPNNVGIISTLQGAQQLDQLQRSLSVHHSQQLLSSSPTASNQSSGQQQQQLDPLHQAWQTALLFQIQNSQDPPSINVQPSANVAPSSTRQEENGVDEGQSMPDEKPT